jgi:hypothetical protein
MNENQQNRRWRHDHDTAKAAEDFFQKITGLKPMPTRWPLYDFKGTPFMGYDGQTMQIKGSDFHDRHPARDAYEEEPDTGQWHWTKLDERADISVLIGFHKKWGEQCFVLTSNFVSHLENRRDVYCGVSRGRLSRTGKSAAIAYRRIPRESLKEFIDKLCAWMCKNKHREEGIVQSKRSMKEFWKLYELARKPGTEYGKHSRRKRALRRSAWSRSFVRPAYDCQ